MSLIQSKQNLEFLTVQHFTLLQIGIDINTLKRAELLRNFWKFFLLISGGIFVKYGLINFVAQTVSNIDEATGAFSIFNEGCLIFIKVAVFLVKGDQFLKLIYDMNLLAEKANPEEYKKWLAENRRSQLLGKMYFYACLGSVVCGCILPLISMAYDYKQNSALNMKLPLAVKFPFDKGGVMGFVISYMLCLIYTYALPIMTVGIDTLYGWYIHGISGHFRILRCKLENTVLKLQNNDCSDFSRDIGHIVRYHNATLQFIQELNTIFGEILWAEVMLSCLQMCFVVYTLNNDDDVSNMPFNFMVFVALIIQLVIYCFGGEKIKNESFMLSLDFYLKFPWHKMSAQQKKLMLLPLMRSQKLSVLRGLFFDVDRNLLVYIIKTAFSVNALISAINK